MPLPRGVREPRRLLRASLGPHCRAAGRRAPRRPRAAGDAQPAHRRGALRRGGVPPGSVRRGVHGPTVRPVQPRVGAAASGGVCPLSGLRAKHGGAHGRHGRERLLPANHQCVMTILAQHLLANSSCALSLVVVVIFSPLRRCAPHSPRTAASPPFLGAVVPSPRSLHELAQQGQDGKSSAVRTAPQGADRLCSLTCTLLCSSGEERKGDIRVPLLSWSLGAVLPDPTPCIPQFRPDHDQLPRRDEPLHTDPDPLDRGPPEPLQRPAHRWERARGARAPGPHPPRRPRRAWVHGSRTDSPTPLMVQPRPGMRSAAETAECTVSCRDSHVLSA